MLLNEIQSMHSCTRRALRCPKPANNGLRNGARHKLECRDWISLRGTVLHNMYVLVCVCRGGGVVVRICRGGWGGGGVVLL